MRIAANNNFSVSLKLLVQGEDSEVVSECQLSITLHAHAAYAANVRRDRHLKQDTGCDTKLNFALPSLDTIF